MVFERLGKLGSEGNRSWACAQSGAVATIALAMNDEILFIVSILVTRTIPESVVPKTGNPGIWPGYSQ